MCYSVTFSTTSTEDFAVHGPFYYIDALPSNAREFDVLAYPHRWYLGSRYGGCSCYFWHEDPYNYMPDFTPPEPWMGEQDPEDVEATTAFFNLVARVVGGGHRIDVVDVSDDMMPQYVERLEVSLGNVPQQMLRFYNGWRLDFLP